MQLLIQCHVVTAEDTVKLPTLYEEDKVDMNNTYYLKKIKTTLSINNLGLLHFNLFPIYASHKTYVTL